MKHLLFSAIRNHWTMTGTAILLSYFSYLDNYMSYSSWQAKTENFHRFSLYKAAVWSFVSEVTSMNFIEGSENLSKGRYLSTASCMFAYTPWALLANSAAKTCFNMGIDISISTQAVLICLSVASYNLIARRGKHFHNNIHNTLTLDEQVTQDLD